jgi:adenylyltransferase/sulfurtransferase
VFPTPPPSESVLSCGEEVILEPVVGVMGVLMAVEAVKIVVANVKPADMAAMRTAKPEPPNQEKQSLLLYSAFGNSPFRSVRLHEKRAHCPSCSENASITRESLIFGFLHYATFCGVRTSMQILNNHDHISAKTYSKAQEESDDEPLLIDVGEEVQFNICHVQNSVNISFSDIVAAVKESVLLATVFSTC